MPTTYPTEPISHPPSGAPASNLYPPPSARGGESASPSDSEDGARRSASDLKTEDDDALDEESLHLTSQTLNADGTPKRPMNAFMIFARKRRPQISAEHQSLRTGDISKLLSQEWNTMPASEKQFYLEKAKLLKDRFNSKYPDYVYRRRPNNSRRRRKDGTIGSRAGDGHDGGDDYGPDDVNDGSYATDEKPILAGNGARAAIPGTTPGYSYPLPSSVTYGGHNSTSSSDHRYPPANSSIGSEPATATAMSAGTGRHGPPHSFYNHNTLTHSSLQHPSYEPADWPHESRGGRTASGWYNSHEREGSNYINTSSAPTRNGDMLSTLSTPFYSTQHPAGEGQGWLPSQYVHPASENASSPQHAHPDSPIHYTHPMPPLRHASSYEDREGLRHSSSHSHSGSDRDMYPSPQEYSNSTSHARSAGSVPPFYDTSTSSGDSYRSSHTTYWPRHSDSH